MLFMCCGALQLVVVKVSNTERNTLKIVPLFPREKINKNKKSHTQKMFFTRMNTWEKMCRIGPTNEKNYKQWSKMSHLPLRAFILSRHT